MQRREYIAVAGGMVATGLAGCSGGGSGTASTGSADESGASTTSPDDQSAGFSGSKHIKNLGFETEDTAALFVEVSDKVYRVIVTNQEGEQEASQMFDGPATKATVLGGHTASGSKLTFTAYNSSNKKIDEVTQTFKPTFEVSNLQNKAFANGKTPEDFENDPVEYKSVFVAVVDVTNGGNAPLYLTSGPVATDGLFGVSSPPADWAADDDTRKEQLMPGESKRLRLEGKTWLSDAEYGWGSEQLLRFEIQKKTQKVYKEDNDTQVYLEREDKGWNPDEVCQNNPVTVKAADHNKDVLETTVTPNWESHVYVYKHSDYSRLFTCSTKAFDTEVETLSD